MANTNLAQERMRFHGQRSTPCGNGALRRFGFRIKQHGDAASMNDFTTHLDDVSRRPFARVRAALNLVWLRGHDESFRFHLGYLRSNGVDTAVKADTKTPCISSIRAFSLSGYNKATFISVHSVNHQEMPTR
jgi:hypothetical protein